MTGSLEALVGATALLVVSHVVLSAMPGRPPLGARLGPWPFRVVYSTVAFALLGWMIAAFAAAPRLDLWQPPAILRLAAAGLVLVAFFFVVAGMTTRNPTAVGQEKAIDKPPLGIIAVTRHPAMWGILLWGIAHLLANGDARGRSCSPAWSCSRWRGWGTWTPARRSIGSGPGTFAAATSTWPFAAVAQGRARIVLGNRMGTGRDLVLYAGFSTAIAFCSASLRSGILRLAAPRARAGNNLNLAPHPTRAWAGACLIDGLG